MTAFAHKIAIEAVTNLKSSKILVRSNGPGNLSEVEDGDYAIRFYASHIGFAYMPKGKWDDPDTISFDVEEKLYLNSNHSTKISFFSPELGVKYDKEFHRSIDEKETAAEMKRREKKVLEFIEKLMVDANIKPIPRFSLDEQSKRSMRQRILVPEEKLSKK
jgi:hypothetical protein